MWRGLDRGIILRNTSIDLFQKHPRQGIIKPVCRGWFYKGFNELAQVCGEARLGCFQNEAI